MLHITASVILLLVVWSSLDGEISTVVSEPDRQRRQKSREDLQQQLKPKVPSSANPSASSNYNANRYGSNSNSNTKSEINPSSNSNSDSISNANGDNQNNINKNNRNNNNNNNINNNNNNNFNNNNKITSGSDKIEAEVAKPPIFAQSAHSCPVCPVKKDLVKVSLRSLWLNNLALAFACTCQQLIAKKDDGLAQAIMYSLYNSRHFIYPLNYPPFDSITNEPASTYNWEIIGPFPVSKLELDGDPLFATSSTSDIDIATHVLTDMSNNSHISELFSLAEVTWRSFQPKPNGQIDVHFPVAWNDVAQGVSSAAALEFQAWARSSTFVRKSGIYIVSCQGPHSVYIRNDNTTRFLTGDVYRSQILESVVDLRAGPVGIVIPLRGVAQTSFNCKLSPSIGSSSSNTQSSTLSTGSLKVYPPTNIPDLLELDVDYGGKLNHAYLFSDLFTLPIMNRHAISMNIEVKIEPPSGFQGDYSVVVARNSKSNFDEDDCDSMLNPSAHFKCKESKRDDSRYQSSLTPSTILPPGQMVNLPIQIRVRPRSTSADLSRVFIPCKRGSFIITVIPSRGSPERVSMELPCRRINQSFLISYFDQDDSIAQAGIVFPLRASPEKIFLDSLLPTSHKLLRSTVLKPIKKASAPLNVKAAINGEGLSDFHGLADNMHSNLNTYCHRIRGGYENTTELSHLTSTVATYPVFLSLHGTGISPGSQADAYKVMPRNCKEYIFGIEGYWLVAPSRHGAHNWEAIGETAALNSISGLHHFLTRFPEWPQVDMDFSVFAGHSMGGHGAWILSMNNPERITCISATAGWISKEEYGNSNSFYNLDISNSYVDASLKSVFEKSWDEFHVDRHISNYQGKDVYIRVGASDMTTHPWYSRRMYRLLKSHGVNVSFDEAHTKQHWWWDTDLSNDGGVLNDHKMRKFYSSCLLKSNNEWKQKYNQKCSVLKNLPGNSFSAEKVSQGTTDDIIDNRESAIGKVSPPGKLNEGIAKCFTSLDLTVTNPSSNSGLCGFRILHQNIVQSPSKLILRVSSKLSSNRGYNIDSFKWSGNEALSGNSVINKKVAYVTSKNVKRFEIDLSKWPVFFDLNELYINNKPMLQTIHSEIKSMLSDKNLPIESIIKNSSLFSQSFIHLNIDICLDYRFGGDIDASGSVGLGDLAANSYPRLCGLDDVSKLFTKTLENYGPLRMVFSRPYLIIYGTNSDVNIRVAMKDLAIYIANSHYSSYHTVVRAISDIEYKNGKYDVQYASYNIIFVGGPAQNRILRKLCFSNSEIFEKSFNYSASTKYSYYRGKIGSLVDNYLCYSPIRFNLHGSEDHSNLTVKSFGIGGYLFEDDMDDSLALISTLPILQLPSPQNQQQPLNGRSSDSKGLGTNEHLNIGNSIMGVIIHSNTVAGYQGLSRLAWPVVPPMVRGSYSNNLPDYMVFGASEIWRLGAGAVKMAGYWDADWKYDPAQSYHDI